MHADSPHSFKVRGSKHNTFYLRCCCCAAVHPVAAVLPLSFSSCPTPCGMPSACSTWCCGHWTLSRMTWPLTTKSRSLRCWLSTRASMIGEARQHTAVTTAVGSTAGGDCSAADIQQQLTEGQHFQKLAVAVDKRQRSIATCCQTSLLMPAAVSPCHCPVTCAMFLQAAASPCSAAMGTMCGLWSTWAL